MDCFGRNFECLYGCDLSCIAFTEIITATSMLTLRLRDCSGNKCRFSPGLVLRLLRAVWKTIGTGCQVEGFSFSSPPQRSQRCLCSLSSRFGSLSAVEPHLTFVLFSCGRCMQYRITAMWKWCREHSLLQQLPGNPEFWISYGVTTSRCCKWNVHTFSSLISCFNRNE